MNEQGSLPEEMPLPSVMDLLLVCLVDGFISTQFTVWPALYVHLTPWYVLLVMCYVAFMVIVESVRYRI